MKKEDRIPLMPQYTSNGSADTTHNAQCPNKGCGRIFHYEEIGIGIIHLKCGEWIDLTRLNGGASWHKLEWCPECLKALHNKEAQCPNKEYISFRELEFKGKTKKFAVVPKKNQDDSIATILWSGGWRSYVLEIDERTHWSSGCLKQIINFIDKLMEERKASHNKERTNKEESK